MVDLIRTKRFGGELDALQIDWLMQGVVAGTVPDEQTAALLMAIVFQGMGGAELHRWTTAMVASGRRVDLRGLDRPTVDKHSTGGVGDKISLVLCPLVAACGAAVPQLSGRGLGHTGGTLDKLDAIPGWKAALDPEQFLAQLADVGAVIAAASDDLAPADRHLYALRDVTGTVASVPLIASSIMSKKIAEGTGALVLDVKVGSGAFLPTQDQARELAATMVALGESAGVRTSALLTDMEVPLGRTAGNALEVREAVEVLAGGGPPDVVGLTVALARVMLELVGLTDVDPADVLADGRAMDVWRAMVRAQGGDPAGALPAARHVEEVRAVDDGVVVRLDALAVGQAAWRTGAGRERREDPVSAGAGLVWSVRPGDAVRRGDVLFEIHVDDATRLHPARLALEGAIELGAVAPPARPLVIDRIG
jgi:thymidine phosphorylase